MPPARHEAQKRLGASERREQIIDSARGVFERSGLAGARTRDLAAAAGVNEALLYRHFSSKDELFEAAVAGPLVSAVAGLVESAGAPPQEFDASGAMMHERTKRFVVDLLGAMDEIGPLLGIVLFGQAESASTFFTDRIAPALEQVRGVVEANLPAWSHRDFDLELIVTLTFGMTWFLSVADRLGERDRDREAVAEQITTLLLDGLGRPTGAELPPH